MKLRNKKTGEIVEWLTLKLMDLNEIEFDYMDMRGHERSWSYSSLEKFNEEWEDYEPAEPLIKDAGMREVLRLWAKVNLIPSNATTIEYQLAETLTGTETEFWDNNLHIMFYGNIAPNAVHGKIYTIAELCGEDNDEA